VGRICETGCDDQNVAVKSATLWFHSHVATLPKCACVHASVYGSVRVRRCNLALMLMTDLVLDTSLCIDWTVHLPFILHLAILGLLHRRQRQFLC